MAGAVWPYVVWPVDYICVYIYVAVKGLRNTTSSSQVTREWLVWWRRLKVKMW